MAFSSMDRQNCSVYVYTDTEGFSDAIKQKLQRIPVKTFPEVDGQYDSISDDILEDIRSNADVLFSSPPIIDKVLKGDNKLQWAQSYTTGMDGLSKETRLDLKNVQVTKMGEGREEAMSQYVLGFIISRERHFLEIIQAHQDKEWIKCLQMNLLNIRQLSSLTVGILGTGQIGTRIAKVLDFFGLKLYGLCCRPKENIDDLPFKKIWQKNGLSYLLQECDYLINVLPGTSETKDLLSGYALKSCKNKKPYFINIGRADVIDINSLEKAIREKWISGALLDVVESEPLPPDDPLWSIPNVTITPHCSAVPNNIDKMKGFSNAVIERLPGIKVKTFQEESGQYYHISDAALEEIRCNADVLLSSPPIIEKVLQGKNKLKWAQSYSTGLDWFSQEKIAFLENVQLTKMGEGREEAMSQYVLGFIISRERRFPELVKGHNDKEWEKCRQNILRNVRPLSSLTVGILGMGRIGKQIANSLDPFGMNINGMCRHPKESNNDFPFKKIWQKNGLSALLEECDYIVNVLPGTSETKDMLSGGTLKSCKNKKPYFINIGRADIIDTDSLEKAISEGWISGALLDVVEPEPLPPYHSLWSIPNVTITPHISGVPSNRNQMIDLFARNLEKFLNNQPLLYTFDCKSGY